jgi:GntR family transcriptional regulator
VEPTQAIGGTRRRPRRAASDALDVSLARRAKRHGLPLYYQVMRDLKEQIVSGKLGPGDRLPSEADLTSRFGVSRVVVRQALQILEDEALIERERGRGTFVSQKVVDDATPRITGSLEDLIHMSPGTTLRVTEFRLVKAAPDLAEVFGVETGTELFFAKRVRLVDGLPFAVLTNYIPFEVGACISVSDLTRQPLITLIEQQAGVDIEWASQVYEAVAADEEMAGLLGVDLLTPLLKLTLKVYAADGSVVDLARVFYRSDRYRHHGYLARNRQGEARFWNAWESPRATPPEQNGERGSATEEDT